MRPLEQFVAAVHESVLPGKSATFDSDLSPDSTREAVRLLHSVVDACKTVEHRLCQTPHGGELASPEQDDLLDSTVTDFLAHGS